MCMHVSTPCFIIVGFICYPHNFFTNTAWLSNCQLYRKASTLEKRGMKIPWEAKVQECLVFGGYFNSSQIMLLKSHFLQIKCWFPSASWPSNTQLPYILKAQELSPGWRSLDGGRGRELDCPYGRKYMPQSGETTAPGSNYVIVMLL